MFNLDQAVTHWRRQMTAAGLQTPDVLNELEGHLREDVAARVSAGTPEADAFQLAVSRIGSPDSVGLEFNKLCSLPDGYVTVGSILWLAASATLAIFLSRGLFAGRLSLLLSAHVFTLTTGYGTALLAGLFGIFYVCCRSFRALSPAGQQGLVGAVRLANQSAMLLVALGLILGLVWSKQNLGGYLVAGPREIGTLCASLWLLTWWLIQRFGQLGDRFTMLFSIAGNMIVGMAWFGAGILADNPDLHSYGIAGVWPLALFMGFHLLFLVMGAAPGPENTETQIGG
ncbi:MAG: cytochrome biosis protein [Pedosphaera sp.]|nr:cytochrome biosis protein [Pedosphaera sp.]